MSAAKICPGCETALAEWEKVCPCCGLPAGAKTPEQIAREAGLDGPDSEAAGGVAGQFQPSVSGFEQPAASDAKRRKLFWVLGVCGCLAAGVFILIAVIIAGSFYIASRPDTCVEEYLTIAPTSSQGVRFEIRHDSVLTVNVVVLDGPPVHVFLMNEGQYTKMTEDLSGNPFDPEFDLLKKIQGEWDFEACMKGKGITSFSEVGEFESGKYFLLIRSSAMANPFGEQEESRIHINVESRISF